MVSPPRFGQGRVNTITMTWYSESNYAIMECYVFFSAMFTIFISKEIPKKAFFYVLITSLKLKIISFNMSKIHDMIIVISDEFVALDRRFFYPRHAR